MNTKLFGQWLLEKGYVTREQLLQALAEQRRSTSTLGDLAVAVGMLSIHEVDAIHLRQQSELESFSQAAVNLGLLTEQQLAELLHPHSAERLLLGQILVAYGHVDEETLQEALKDHSGERGKDDTALLRSFRTSDLSEVGPTCVSVMGSVYRETMGTPVSCLAVPAAKAVSANQHVWSQVIAQGEDRFILGLQVGEEDACRMAEAVLGMHLREFDDLVQDSVGEFLNLVTGHVCGNLDDPQAGLSASTPAFQKPAEFLQGACPKIAVLGTGDEVEFTFIIARPAEAPVSGKPVDSAWASSVHPFEPQISLT